MPPEAPIRTLADVYDQSIGRHGARELFGSKHEGRWRFVTYADFGSLVDRFGAGLASMGVGSGDRVAMISNNRVEWAVAAYACYRAGVAFVPMYEAQNPAEWAFIVRDCGAKVLVVVERVAAAARDLLGSAPALERVVVVESGAGGAPVDARVTTYAALLAAGAPGAPPARRPSPDDFATLLYTSGTTGDPKGVVLTHGNLASNVAGAQSVFPLGPGDRSLSILPWAHAFGQTAELHMLFSVGASMAICEGVDRILDNLAEVQPTILACVPTIFSRLYTAVQQQLDKKPPVVRRLTGLALRVKAHERAGERPALYERAVVRAVDALVFRKVRARLGGRLRFAISGGAALAREVAEFIDAIGIVVFEGYGLTETSPVVSANAPGASKIGSVGRPFPGVRVVVDTAAGAAHDDGGGAAARGREGEIVVYGPNVMKGYFHRPEETAAVMTPDGGLRTGDMGYLDDDGFLVITGRIKEQYKLANGKYVVPSPLEDRLKLSPYVANAMVYGDNRPYNVALVVPNRAAVKKWADEHGVELPDGDAALDDARVRELFAAEIKAQSAGFKGFERIADFALVAGDFTIEGGMLTPKMSLKRRKVLEAYGAVLDRLYAKEKRAGAAA